MSCEVVIDLHQWMPSHGENEVVTRSENGDFIVEFSFDNKVGGEDKKEIVFDFPSFFSVGSFPGVEAIRCSGDFSFESGAVIKTTNSGLANEWATYWTEAYAPSLATCYHYMIFFTSENKVIHVIARNVIVR